ncbi:hypothetical protein ACIHDR_38570 [Nocardia sp. NPDC052278]|uniref:hypothetical protein n=1 Tax=unclassified Nocardia TaxID=2637762 RepID=UPI0036CB5C70
MGEADAQGDRPRRVGPLAEGRGEVALGWRRAARADAIQGRERVDGVPFARRVELLHRLPDGGGVDTQQTSSAVTDHAWYELLDRHSHHGSAHIG